LGKFDNKVVIITGAGGGIGRSHALAFAKEGAKVVVNDLGGARDGKGQSQNMADKVVEEIKAAGGEAVANYDSVADMVGAEQIVKTAMDNYGRIDILVNNAGILRDKTFLKMDEQMWDLVVAVHLKGTFAVTNATAPIMKEQESGRIINTTSMAGLLGNFGQANYSAAKAGIYGFSRTLALEMERYGVTVNCVAPLAKTRMTEDIDAIPEEMKPEQVTKMVEFLASEDASDITGRVFGVHGQELFEYVMERTPGVEKKTSDYWTPEEIKEKFEDITKKAVPEGTTGNIQALLPKLNEVLKSLGLQVHPLGAVAVAPSKVEITLSDMFQKMVDVFLPDKAGDWKGVVQFDVTGDEPQALYVDNGKAEVKVEKAASPDCVVTSDKESMLAMMRGDADPTKLYMQGKMKASKLPVFMQIGKIFALDKIPALVKKMEEEIETPAEAAAEVTIPLVFEKIVEVFLPEKAKGWKATVQFDISGDPHTLYVEGDKAEYKAEKASSPDCIITTDTESMLAMAKGETDATKLYMKGKIKANKMPVFMKVGQVFDLNAIPGMLKPAVTETTPTTPVGEQTLSGMFLKLKDVFVPENAGGFSGLIQFMIKGVDAPHQALYVENGNVEIKAEKGEKPKLTVRTDEETINALFKGELDATKAVMSGKIKADHTSLLMKFGKMFKLEDLPAKLSAAPATAPAGMNRDFIGRWYQIPAQHVKPENVKQYAKATNESNTSYYGDDDQGLKIPPVFPVTFLGTALEDVVLDPDLKMDVLRMVHSEQDIRYYRPLKAWDLVYPVAEVIDIEPKSGGSEIMTIKVTGRVLGQAAYEMDVKLFVRGRSKKKKSKTAPIPEVDRGTPTFTHTMKVNPDQTKRYADASGDHNPIHLDPETAKAAGLPDIILHGLCTMAFTGQAVIEKLVDGDSNRLERLKVRFSRPVLLNQDLITNGWIIKEEEGKKYVEFETIDSQGVKVITQGEATLI
jgi:NAD(P)-dependent dehydrogenase (short-subunit alcohol dehydrogenase family)/putative sterol carrier protein/acyl dehydratase